MPSLPSTSLALPSLPWTSLAFPFLDFPRPPLPSLPLARRVKRGDLRGPFLTYYSLSILAPTLILGVTPKSRLLCAVLKKLAPHLFGNISRLPLPCLPLPCCLFHSLPFLYLALDFPTLPFFFFSFPTLRLLLPCLSFSSPSFTCLPLPCLAVPSISFHSLALPCLPFPSFTLPLTSLPFSSFSFPFRHCLFSCLALLSLLLSSLAFPFLHLPSIPLPCLAFHSFPFPFPCPPLPCLAFPSFSNQFTFFLTG